MPVSRRRFLAASAATAGAGLFAPAVLGQDRRTLYLLAHRSHQQALETGPSGSVPAAWSESTGTTIEYLTFDTGPLAERLFREASLDSTEIDVSFFLDSWANPNSFGLLAPLDDLMAEAPIEEFEDFFAGPVSVVTDRNGVLRGIPVRQNVAGLHFNEVLFEEQGLSAPPASIEEFLDFARRLTYTRSDGTQVTGFVLPNQASNLTHFARGWNADFITLDGRVTASEPPMVTAITALRTLYEEGAFPRNFPTILQEEAATWIQTGRAAMVITNMSRNPQLNEAGNSPFAGHIRAANVPVSEALRDQFAIAPVGVSFWSMVIPANAEDKAMSWDFIRTICSKENTRRLALNGNGPLRQSLYEDPDYLALVPYAAFEREALTVARPTLPAFDAATRAADLIQEEVEAAILGYKEPQAAMDDLSARLEPLLSE